MRKQLFAAVLALALLLAASPGRAGQGRSHGGHGGGSGSHGGGHAGSGWYGGQHGGSGWHGGHHGGWHGRYYGGGHGGWYSGTRFVFGIGPGYWWGPGWWYGAPAFSAYGPPFVYGSAPPPPVYVERAPVSESAAWYYCPSAGAYYPSVPSCPEPWVEVAPSAE